MCRYWRGQWEKRWPPTSRNGCRLQLLKVCDDALPMHQVSIYSISLWYRETHHFENAQVSRRCPNGWGIYIRTTYSLLSLFSLFLLYRPLMMWCSLLQQRLLESGWKQLTIKVTLSMLHSWSTYHTVWLSFQSARWLFICLALWGLVRDDLAPCLSRQSVPCLANLSLPT